MSPFLNSIGDSFWLTESSASLDWHAGPCSPTVPPHSGLQFTEVPASLLEHHTPVPSAGLSSWNSFYMVVLYHSAKRQTLTGLLSLPALSSVAICPGFTSSRQLSCRMLTVQLVDFFTPLESRRQGQYLLLNK